MPIPTLTFTVHGLPAPQGSKRHVGGGVMIESSKKVKPWREDVKYAALRALEEAPDWDTTVRQVTAHIVFTLPRPQSHYRTGQYATLLRNDAPAYVSTKPDLDKLLRSTGDALTTAGVYPDDARVVQLFAAKVYTGSSGRTLWTSGGLDVPGAWISLTGITYGHG